MSFLRRPMPPGDGRAYNRRGVAGRLGPQFFFPDGLLAVWRFYDPRYSLVYADGPGDQVANGGFEAGFANWTLVAGGWSLDRPPPEAWGRGGLRA